MEGSLMTYPMFAMFALTLGVLILLFRARLAAVRAGLIKPTYFLTYSSGQQETERTLAISRHFSNLFEAPILFYAACLTVMFLKVANPLYLGLAWGYVAMRVLHSFIHTGSNNLRWRIIAYMGSWVFLAALWVGILISIMKV